MKRVLLLINALLPALSVAHGGFPEPDPADIRERLRLERPRLMLTAERLERLRAQGAADARLQQYLAQALAAADTRVSAPFDGRTVGGQSLFTSFVQLGLAWHWTAEAKYRDAAVALMQEVNTRDTLAGANELQLGMMANAVALGYDWFHAELPEAMRDRARALLAEAIERCIRQYGGRDGEYTRNWWVGNEFNWNSVINGSFILATLAVADELEEPVDWLLPRIFPNLRRAIEAYNPDGVFAEGVGYWMYGTMHLVYALASLESALGTDFGLADNAPGLERTGDWVIAANSPIDRDATFADPGLNWWNGNRHPLLWLAERFDQPRLAARMLWYTSERKSHYPEFSLLWHPEAPPAPHPYQLPLDHLFRSANSNAPMAVTRGHATDPAALWAYIKGGNHQKMRNHHGHVDIGSFELGALADHWAHDLAADDYSIQSGDDRFERVYRMATRSHNTLMIDHQNQPLSAVADFIRYASDDDGMHAVLDMGKAYPAASRAHRGLASINGRRALLVQDELELATPRTVTWGMMTDKAIELDGDTATLRSGVRRLRARILEPAGAVFSIESAYQPPPQNPNSGFNRLVINLPDSLGEIRIAVLLSPVWTDGEVADAAVIPLDQWPSDIDPPPPAGTAILYDQPSAAGIGSEAGGDMPLQTIDAVATGPGAIGPAALAALPGIHINHRWKDAQERIFAQSQGLPQTRNHLAFSAPNGYGLRQAVRFVFDTGGRSDTYAGGYNYTGPRVVVSAGNSIYLGQALAEPGGGYAITFGTYSRQSHSEELFGFAEADAAGAPHRVRAAGFILSGIGEGRVMTADFLGAGGRLLATLECASPGETATEEFTGAELFFGHDAGHDIENWIHRIEVRGDAGGNAGFDDFAFTPVHAGGAHPWSAAPALDGAGRWRMTAQGVADTAAYPWVYHNGFAQWAWYLPGSLPDAQLAWLAASATWIHTAESAGPRYFDYGRMEWRQLGEH
jgi:hypothetical protein